MSRRSSIRKPILFLLLNLVVFTQLKAQDDLKKYVNTMAPNVASFEKYGKIPISFNTGRISESIPLYDFEIDANVHIPLTLSYNNDGMKPDDVPTWVGHGWDFMPGGYITQDIKGIDDLNVDGLANPDAKNLYLNFATGESTAEDRYHFIRFALDGSFDSQQDVFSLNLMGKSLEFYFDGPQIRFIRYEPYKIVLTPDNYFEVTDEKGYKYLFGLKAGCSGSGPNNPSESNALGGSTTWVLTKITLPDGSEVTLTYQLDAIYGANLSSAVYVAGALSTDGLHFDGSCFHGFTGPNVVYSTSGAAQHILQSITYKGRVISFNTIGRNDLVSAGGTSAKALSSIQVKNENNQIVRTINFYYDNNARLKLNQVAVADNITQAPVKKYNFEYYRDATGNLDLSDIPLANSPNRTYAFDHWGYYNGEISNTFWGVPRANYGSVIPEAGGFTGTNNRDANGNASRAGMLKRITFPTGGYSEFEYEPNGKTYQNIFVTPLFLRFNAGNLTTLIPGALDNVTCPELEGQDGHKTGSFTVSQANNGVLTWGFQATPGSNNDICWLSIIRPDGVEILKTGKSEQKSEDIQLPAGTYTYHLVVGCSTAQQQNDNYAYFSVSQNNNQPISIAVGGNRIQRVKTYDALTNTVDVRKYEYEEPEFYQEPNYLTVKDVYSYVLFNGAKLRTGLCGQQYIIGVNVIPFEGNVIYYRKVTEYSGENGENGKTVYSYPVQNLYYSNYTQSPFPGITNLSWRGNDPEKIDQFAKAGNNFVVQKSVATVYTDAPSPVLVAQMPRGIKFGSKAISLNDVYEPVDYTLWFNQGTTYLPNDRYNKAAVTTTDYTSSGNIVNTSNYYYSDDYFLPNRIKQTNSKGEILEKFVWYPGDYISSVSNIATLQSRNMIGLPLKTMATNNGDITAGEVNDYDINGNAIAVHRYESSSVQSMPGHNGSLLYPSYFNLKLNLAYAALGKVKEYAPDGNLVMAVAWGYNTTYPIAKVSNATADQVAYTSFETDGTADWSGVNSGNIETVASGTSVTGKKYYRVTGSILSKAGLTASATYKVSYWSTTGSCPVSGSISMQSGRSVSLGGGTWTYYEHQVTGVTTVTVAGDGVIDELRLYPATAQMSSYSYEPLLGMTSECDNAQHISYYEYDGMARLQLVRDQDQKILKKLCYSFAGQQPVAGCSFASTARSQTFTRSNCGPNTLPGTFIYTVPAGKYTSIISQADAEQQATNDVNANGQAAADQNASCSVIYSSAQQSGIFYRDNCSLNTIALAYSYTVPAGRYTSLISQADAEQQAINDVNANGQAAANQNGACNPLYYNVERSQTFTRNNCETGMDGGAYTYTVPAGRYSSPLNQALADYFAMNDILSNGQNAANQYGACTPQYTGIFCDNELFSSDFHITYYNINTGQTYNFTSPYNGQAQIGAVPAGYYNITVSYPGPYYFNVNFCNAQVYYAQYSSTTYNVPVNPGSCNLVTIWYYD